MESSAKCKGDGKPDLFGLEIQVNMIFLVLKYPQTSYLYHTQEIPLFLKGNQTIYPEKMISLHESQSPHLKHGDDKTDLITGAA